MMFDLLGRIAGGPAFDDAGLGAEAIARPIAGSCSLPADAIGVVAGPGGHTRRVAAGGRVVLAKGEAAWCFHPGPYDCDLVPFAAAPEIGLRLRFVVDSPDPRAAQQRFDLYLASEAVAEITLAGFGAQAEAALRRELAQGNLQLPPCATLDEWNAFRGGLNQLMYTRFGVTVDDCVPVDLAGSRDYARALRARADAAPAAAIFTAGAGVAAVAAQADLEPARDDARALRRLFLELPCLMCRLRMAALPQGQALFRQQQALLNRLDLASLAANAMPSLGLAAPGRPLAPVQQLRRARQSMRAADALDEAWALLARFERADDDAALTHLLDDADRILANLELALEERKRIAPEDEA